MTENATESYDAIVVGARCAGSPLAALLARSGARVALLERAATLGETLSSHVFETDGVTFLRDLGVLDAVTGTGAPLVSRTHTRVEDVVISMELPLRAGDVGGMASVRRALLDPILAGAAREAGAVVRFGTSVTGLLREGARVSGVRASAPGGGELQLRARLVVGADGRSSTVARLAGARRYNLTPNRRPCYWAYFEGARFGPEPTFLTHRWGERFVLAIPTDSGLDQVLMWPEMREADGFRADPEKAFVAYARACEPIAAALEGARMAGPVLGARSWDGYFRDASGPGWVLCGDAGHFKSPAPGRGIGDAFIQAGSLAKCIAGCLGASGDAIDRAMRRWGRARDREFAEHYWLAYDLEDPGLVPAVLTEILRGLQAHGEASLFLELLSHRVRPTEVLTPQRVAAATGRALARKGADRRAFLGELGALGARELRRRWLNLRPAYERSPAPARAEAGALA